MFYFLEGRGYFFNPIFWLHCVVPENIHTAPTEGIGNSREVGRVSKAPKLKATYEDKLKFPEGWGGGDHRANPFSGGRAWIFYGFTHLHHPTVVGI